ELDEARAAVPEVRGREPDAPALEDQHRVAPVGRRLGPRRPQLGLSRRLVDFREKHEPRFQSLHEPGEQLRGVCAATQQSTFKGRAVAVAVTDRRLLLQPLDRRGEPSGEALTLTPATIDSAEVDGAGGGWASVGPALLDVSAATLKLRLTDGEKL